MQGRRERLEVCKCKGEWEINNKSNPEKLHCWKSLITRNTNPYENEKAGNHDKGDMELKELQDVVHKVAAVNNGWENGAEVVVEQLDIAS